MGAHLTVVQSAARIMRRAVTEPGRAAALVSAATARKG